MKKAEGCRVLSPPRSAIGLRGLRLRVSLDPSLNAHFDKGHRLHIVHIFEGVNVVGLFSDINCNSTAAGSGVCRRSCK